MPPNLTTTQFWIGLPPFLFLVKGGSRPTFYAQTHTTLVDLARLYTDGPSIADGETVEVRQYEHCRKLHSIMTDKKFRANVHRLQQGKPFTMQRSDTKVWAELRAKSEHVWASDGPGSLREMQAAAERSMRERYRSPSPARSYIMISSDEEEHHEEPGGYGHRTLPYVKREPSNEETVELLAAPSSTPARSRKPTTSARTPQSQLGANGTSSVSALHTTRRRPRIIKIERIDHVLIPSSTTARAVPQQKVTGTPSTSAPIRPAHIDPSSTPLRDDNGRLVSHREAYTSVGIGKRSTVGPLNAQSQAVQVDIARTSSDMAATSSKIQSGSISSTSHRSPAKRRRGRSISSDDTRPPTRLRVSPDQIRTQSPLSELSALTESSSGIPDSDLPQNYADLPVGALLKCGVHGENLYKILSARGKVKAEMSCSQCVKKGRACFIGRHNKRGRPTKVCIYCQSYSVSCSLGG